MKGFDRGHVAPVFRLLLMLAVIHFTSATLSSAQETSGKGFTGGNARLEKITFSTKKEGTLIRLYSEHPFKYVSYKLSNPLRLAIEIGAVTLGFEPKRIEINGKSVSHISVVQFPEINSIRVELELFAESPVEFTRKPDWLEVLVADTTDAHMNLIRRSGAAKKKKNNRQSGMEKAMAEGGKNRPGTDMIESRKKIEQLEMEKDSLQNELEENRRRYEEASGKAETLQARVAFMEAQLSKIRTKLGRGDWADPSASTEAISGRIAGPDGSGGYKKHGPKDDINKMVSEWLDAWRNEDIGRYGNHYSDNFKFGNKNWREWIDGKRAKFDREGKPGISIEKPEIEQLTQNFARVRFVQTYRSSRFNSKGVKTLSLTKESGVWKILYEDWSRLK